MQRVKPRREERAAPVDEVGDRRVLRAALPSDGAAEDPRMTIGHHALASRLQRQDAALRGIKLIHGSGAL